MFLGPGIGRSPVRFPASRRSFWGHFFANFGMSWDVFGIGLGTLSDGFGMVWEKMSGGVDKIKKIKNDREYFSGVGALKIHLCRLSRTKFWKMCFCRIFVYKLPINRLKRPVCYWGWGIGSIRGMLDPQLKGEVLFCTSV